MEKRWAGEGRASTSKAPRKAPVRCSRYRTALSWGWRSTKSSSHSDFVSATLPQRGGWVHPHPCFRRLSKRVEGRGYHRRHGGDLPGVEAEQAERSPPPASSGQPTLRANGRILASQPNQPLTNP